MLMSPTAMSPGAEIVIASLPAIAPAAIFPPLDNSSRKPPVIFPLTVISPVADNITGPSDVVMLVTSMLPGGIGSSGELKVVPC
jgi:hypothetical protein